MKQEEKDKISKKFQNLIYKLKNEIPLKKRENPSFI